MKQQKVQNNLHTILKEKSRILTSQDLKEKDTPINGKWHWWRLFKKSDENNRVQMYNIQIELSNFRPRVKDIITEERLIFSSIWPWKSSYQHSYIFKNSWCIHTSWSNELKEEYGFKNSLITSMYLLLNQILWYSFATLITYKPRKVIF